MDPFKCNKKGRRSGNWVWPSAFLVVPSIGPKPPTAIRVSSPRIVLTLNNAYTTVIYLLFV